LFIAGSYQRQGSHSEKQPKANPNDDYNLGSVDEGWIAFVPVGTTPGAHCCKEGVGQGQEMNNSRQNNGCFGENERKGSHCGSKVQDEIIGNEIAPEGFAQG
jgi:hypothetical protein